MKIKTGSLDLKEELALELKQASHFTKDYLPLTMEMARPFSKVIGRYLPTASTRWPYEDRVLGRVLPDLMSDIGRFHRNLGPDLVGVLKTSKKETLHNLDRQVLVAFIQFLNKVAPAAAAAIANVVQQGVPADVARPAGERRG